MSDNEREQEAEEQHDPAEEQAAFELDEEGEPQITLDHYYSRRRPPIKSGWTHIISLVAMLIALVMIMIYKDRCGQQVSELMGTMNAVDAGGVPVRYQLPPDEKPGAKNPERTQTEGKKPGK